MGKKTSIIVIVVVAIVSGLAGWAVNLFYLKVKGKTEAQVLYREQLKRDLDIYIGGFRFGMAKQEVYNIAQSLGYEFDQSNHSHIMGVLRLLA